ncbi:MAG TPA: serine hydrolase [Trebonia sp.]|jgi:hypothetical protein|nr:serine hydrolase [Trebonia sp.]
MRELVDGLVQSAQNNGMELYGVHVYRRGEEPVERRLRSDDRENLWSVSKTFVSVALGIAEAEGRLALDDPALTYYDPPSRRDRRRDDPNHDAIWSYPCAAADCFSFPGSTVITPEGQRHEAHDPGVGHQPPHRGRQHAAPQGTRLRASVPAV